MKYKAVLADNPRRLVILAEPTDCGVYAAYQAGLYEPNYPVPAPFDLCNSDWICRMWIHGSISNEAYLKHLGL